MSVFGFPASLPPPAASALAQGDLVLFDGECIFCVRQAARLAKFVGSTLTTLPLQTPDVLSALGIDRQAARLALHLVTKEGQIHLGLEAVVVALRHKPLLGTLVKLYYLPGFRALGDLSYRLVARSRYRLMGRAVQAGECPSGTCAIADHKPAR